MYKTFIFKRERILFSKFKRRGYALFSCLGKEVLVCTLSVATLTYAKADSISIRTEKADSTSQSGKGAVVLDVVDVTASRAPSVMNRAARIVTVLDRGEIAAAPVQSVNDLLKYAVGVDVRQRGAVGAQTDISIRGGNYEQVAILLNGINICDPQTGHNAFDLPLDISDIERIEVLEGPAGRVYGVSSLLGAINVVTKMPQNSSATARVEGGSYGYLTAGARANMATGAWNNSISGSYVRSDGFSRSKAGRLNADYSGGKAFYQGSYNDEFVKVSWHAGLSARGFGSNTFYGAAWDDQFEHTLKTFSALQAETKQGRLRVKPSIYWNHNLDRFELYRGSEDAVPFNYHRTDVFGANLNAYFDWIAGRTAFGVEMRNEDLVSTNLGEPLSRAAHVKGTPRYYEYGLNRTNISFVLEHNVVYKRLALSAGVVAVKNSWNRMNMRVYPGADASLKIIDGLNVYASYNTSLRMPSVTELYYSVGGYKADKYLKPEELSAFEGGLKYSNRWISAKAGVYRNHCKNMIDWIRDTDGGADAVWKSVNFTKVNSIGVESSVDLNLHNAFPSQKILRSFNVAYSYIDQDKQEQGGIQSMSKLEYLRHKLVAGLQMDIIKNLRLGLYYRYQDRTGSYTDTGGNTRDYEPYSIVDARITWSPDRYKLYVEANNIFNKTYVDFGNVPQPGTWIICGASVDLNW